MSDRPITTSDVGRIARVRHRQYLVDDVYPCEAASSTIARLSCIDPDNLGRPLEVIWEKELDAEILSTESWGLLGGRGFDPPDRFSAYYHTLRWNRVTASRTDLLQAPFRAGISIEHYQLEPLRMALCMPRVNLFVADGVGLGKTIEAGLIARELLLRRKVSDIVVCCPSSMLLQWREEMESRFGLLFQIIDRAYVHRIRKERGYNVNPWATHNRFIISHNLIKDEEYAADLRNWLGRELVRPRSLLILDEAHHAAPAAAGAYAITSQFTRRIMELAPKFVHKLFLSATPHNGHSNSFSALMAILDPQRFCQGVKVSVRERDQVLIYRLKEDLRALGLTFPNREVEPVLIQAPVKGTPELELANKLEACCALYENREEDAILRKIVEKTENIYRELGGFGTVLDKNLIQTLRRRGIERSRVRDTIQMLAFRDDEEDQLAALAHAEVSGEEDDLSEDEAGQSPASRESARERIDRRRREKLDKSLDRLRRIMEESRHWLDFRESQFRAALDCSLRLMEIEGGLTPEPTERSKARRYFLPTASLEKNPTWRETLNSLRAPRRRGEDLGAWYARCPIRPIVFEDPGLTHLGEWKSDAGPESRIEPVHMHLEHRISQRLLGRFLSQGFMYQDLSRACLAQTKGSLPLVYLLGRLCLYGHQATRLHEDVIAVCAEWARPEERRSGLQPVDPKRLGDEEFMRRLDDALLSRDTSRITDVKRQELLACADQDIRELQVHLAKKANDLETMIRQELARAGEKEAENTRKLLEDQDKRIDKTLEAREREEAAARTKAEERKAKAGPTLFDTEDDPRPLYDERARRERASEKRAMLKRKKDIEREILEEPDRIRGRYAVQTVRLEPVGIVYLWPEMG